MIEQFFSPGSLREAVRLKRKHRARAAYLAGGTFVNSKDFPLHVTHLIALEDAARREGLDTVKVTRSQVSIGALCTIQQLLDDHRIPAALRAAAARVSSRNIRSAATLGGHVASYRSCSDLIPTLIVLGARLQIVGAGRARVSPVPELRGAPRERIIARVVVPTAGGPCGVASRVWRPSAHARSALNVAVSMRLGRDGAIAAPIIVIAGRSLGTNRAQAVEAALAGQPLHSVADVSARALELLEQTLKPRPCRASCACACRAHSIDGSLAFQKYEAAVLLAEALLEARDELATVAGARG